MKKKPIKKSPKKVAKKTAPKKSASKRIRKNSSNAIDDSESYIVFRENSDDRNSVIITNMPDPMNMNEEEKKQFSRRIGMITGKLSKFMLEMGGMDVSYKINGEEIDDIKKMQEMDIKEKINLAIKEERYEDAQKLKNILENKEPSVSFKEKEENAVIKEILDFISKCRGIVVPKKVITKIKSMCRGFLHTEIKDMGEVYNALMIKHKTMPVDNGEIFVLFKK